MIWFRARADNLEPQKRSGGLCLRVELTESYDASDYYNRGRRDRKAIISPHASFLQLQPDDQAAALGFLETFGPLELNAPHAELELDTQARAISFVELGTESPEKMPPIGVYYWWNLDDFWSKHARYLAVHRIWNALLREPNELVQAWLVLFEDAEKISKAGGHLLKLMPIQSTGLEPRAATGAAEEGVAIGIGTDWKERLPGFERWVRKASPRELRDAAAALILSELSNHSGSKLRSWTRADVPGGRFGFRPVYENDSLWSFLWECFGHDTYNGVGLRLCPNDGKPFYPPRKDRFCCTAREQELSSKRRWWAKNRTKQLTLRHRVRKRRRKA